MFKHNINYMFIPANLTIKYFDFIHFESHKQYQAFTQTVFTYHIVRVIKSRRMRWAGHVERWVEGRGMYVGFGGGNLSERDHWGDPGADGKVILRWIFRKWDLRVWTG